MSRRFLVRAAVVLAAVPLSLTVVPAGAGHAADPDARTTTAPAALAASSKTELPKGRARHLAQSDPAVLSRTDAAPTDVVVKLDYDSTASYRGDVPGYAATSPKVTGRALSRGHSEQRYESRIASIEDRFIAELHRRVKGVEVGERLRTVYGGLALTVPANRAKDIAGIPGVVAVQKNQILRPLTDTSVDFIGAPALYPRLGGESNAGKGVIIGVIDTGVWPEHPSFADNGNLGAPPPRADGTARACDFGENPLTPGAGAFRCNNKLIGGQTFLQKYHLGGDEPPKYSTTRDEEGHGTHTASTAAGNSLASAIITGVNQGPVRGVAPGAWVMAYKVCGPEGCVASDSARAVGQAILDGVNVINFSLSGGEDPAIDVAELAFRDAYAAGIFVATSAGNDGPDASTANHLSPWVTTVAASTPPRTFRSTLTVTGDGQTQRFVGASLTNGAGPAPIAFAESIPGYAGHSLCDVDPPSPTAFAGKIIACERGVNPRIEKGERLKRGGAIGMVLYNPAQASVELDNHWLPTVQLADGTAFKAFLTAHPGATATFTSGQRVDAQADVISDFSSRGPDGSFIKPDIAAPGMDILAGQTPAPRSSDAGAPGQYFQVSGGTSMAAPHISGAALLLKALHPTWTPGQIKSAMMTTATTKALKDDAKTPADSFDMGAGRVQLNIASNPGLTFDETAERMRSIGTADRINAVHLNQPSVNAPIMPGRVTTVRKAVNVTTATQTYRTEATSPAGSNITVEPSEFTVAPGATAEISITIRSGAPTAQYFGEVRLVPVASSSPALDMPALNLPMLHLPVAFVPQQGAVKLTSRCDRGTVRIFETSTCTITASPTGSGGGTVDLETTTTRNLRLAGSTGAAIVDSRVAEMKAVVSGAVPGTPSLQSMDTSTYQPLARADFVKMGDDEAITYTKLPAFRYNGATYTSLTVSTNGYVVVGDATDAVGLVSEPSGISTAGPNNFLAPFGTDLTGRPPEGVPGALPAPGIAAVTSAVGDDLWIVVEWRMYRLGTAALQTFQLWLGAAGDGDPAQDITFRYPVPPTVAPTLPYVVGAENVDGTGGDVLADGALPTGDIRVVSTEPVAARSVSYTVTARGVFPGPGAVTTTMDSPLVTGETEVRTPVEVSARGRGRLPLLEPR